MKKSIITATCLIITSLLVISATISKSSSGAPPSHTGAPNEKTCAAAGCHDDNNINSGTASVQVSLGNDLTDYVPGQTYPVKVRIMDANVTRFGFQIVALDESLADQGTFTIVDSVRTQIVRNMYELKDRTYVTYRFHGTDAVAKGVGEWIVNWTAPKGPKKPLTFYVGAVSANDDMHDKGDHVYTAQLTINSKKQ
jgi:hypothetical protein